MCKKKKKKINYFILGLILLTLVGFILRISYLDYQSYWIDESFSINAAMEINEKGIPMLDSGHYYGRGIIYHYLLAGMIFIFGNNEWATRMISVIFGTLFIPLIYFFVKKLSGKKVAFISAGLITFFSLGIAWSRQARMYQMLQFFFFLSLYWFLEFIEKKNKKSFSMLILLTIITINVHLLGFLLLPIYIGFFAVIPIIEIKDIKKRINKIKKYILKYKYYFIITGICGIIVLFYKHNLFFQVIKTNSNYLTHYIFFLKKNFRLFFYLGIAGLFIVKKLRSLGLYFISYMVIFYFVVFHQKILNFRYLFIVMPIMFILSSESIIFAIKYIKKDYMKGIISIFIIVGIVLSGVFTFMPNKEYYLEDLTPQPDFKRAYEFVEKNLTKEDILISSFSTMPRIYLKRDANYTLDLNMNMMPGKNLKSCINCSGDIYTNTSLILNSESLEILINETSGFLVLDDMALIRTLEYKDIYKKMTVVYINENRYYSGIRVFKW